MIEEGPTAEPFAGERARDFFQCDRQCRWFYGYFGMQKDNLIAAKDIIGTHTTILKKGKFTRVKDKCQCFEKVIRAGKELFQPIDINVPRFSMKKFDTKTTWSGTDLDGFDTSFICVETKDGLKTMTKDSFDPRDGFPLHCGVCSACSARQDLHILVRTRLWITEVMTKVSARFAAPWGHGNGTRLAFELENVGIGFSRNRWDGRTDLPSCMDVWVDNIMCDANSCKSKCWSKFFNAKNQKTEIIGRPRFWHFNAQCLKCDELYCGPAFIKGAGANRRSTGIESDIKRPEWQKCTHGLFSDIPEHRLPTDPKPNTNVLTAEAWLNYVRRFETNFTTD